MRYQILLAPIKSERCSFIFIHKNQLRLIIWRANKLELREIARTLN
jgi:hypothetical protein